MTCTMCFFMFLREQIFVAAASSARANHSPEAICVSCCNVRASFVHSASPLMSTFHAWFGDLNADPVVYGVSRRGAGDSL